MQQNVPSSYSGAHPYRPQCVVDQLAAELDSTERYLAEEAAETITIAVDAGRCPRCGGPLPDGNPVKPAGSRATRCRCVPICGLCGGDESVTVDDSMILWPLQGVQERVGELRSHLVPAILANSMVIGEDGTAPIRMRPHPGGWSEFGFDDSADRAEVAR